MENVQPIQAQKVPLESLGSLIKNAWSLMLENATNLFILSFSQVAISTILINTKTIDSIWGSLLSFLLTLFIPTALILSLTKSQTGEKLELKNIIARALRLLPSFFLLALLTGLFVAGGFVLLIVPGIIFAIWSSFSVYILITEGIKGFSALIKSSAYTSNYVLELLGRSIVIGLITGIPLFSAKIGATGSILIQTPILDSIITGITAPFAICFSFLLFKNLVAIKTTSVVIPEKRPLLIKIFVAIGLAALIFIPLFLGISNPSETKEWPMIDSERLKLNLEGPRN